ncbi:predicted redox protein, regulator of disulfide bond formation [Moorella thermoacetica Y72]|uniref:Predicted redox protein, regulator of disulfide bond formation n=1 Tax=Moorella thermoacetica Y72 TaxID=1325331 RepID=A0A0S6UAT2_NEOTH|nr:predicted redox protein, regulator of disulfide bond formation [Moorella thermoacetica Y72]
MLRDSTYFPRLKGGHGSVHRSGQDVEVFSRFDKQPSGHLRPERPFSQRLYPSHP